MPDKLSSKKYKSSQVNNEIKGLSNIKGTSAKDTYKDGPGLNHITLHEYAYRAQRSRERDQDIELRSKIQNAVFDGLDFQKRLRSFLARFYIIYISIVTALIFYVVIDPIAVYRHVSSYYSNPVKEMLVGAFFANVLSILIIMCKFSFTPIKDMTHQFKGIGGKHWNI